LKKRTIMPSINNFEQILALDLQPIKTKLMHMESGEGWSQQKAEAVEVQYKRFLCLLKKYPEQQMAPLVDVDTFWHYHILDTMKYAVDCDAIFGYFLHHYPYLGMDDDTDEGAREQGASRIAELYEETFRESYIEAALQLTQSGTEFCVIRTFGMTAANDASMEPAQAGTSALNGSAFCAAPSKPAFCAAPAKPVAASVLANAAFCAAPGKPAFCAAPAKPASGSVATNLAFCAAPGKPAFCAAPAKPASGSVAANVAFCAAPGKPAFCAAPAKPALGSVESNAAFCAAPSKPAFCAAPAKPVSGAVFATAAFCAAPSKPAFCAAPGISLSVSAPAKAAFCAAPAKPSFCAAPSIQMCNIGTAKSRDTACAANAGAATLCA
jgi:hypothetical protein